jgi:hypothetical protein
MMVNKFVIAAIVIAVITVFMIYRKKILKQIPALDKLKDDIMKGDGLSKTPEVSAPSFQPNTDGARISSMMKQAVEKYSVRDLEAATSDWNKASSGFTPDLTDKFDLSTGPVKVTDLFPKYTADPENIQQVEDIGQLIRNQVLINDLFGRPGCGCGNRCKCGKALTFSPN